MLQVGTWNLPTWSISALVACYAAFPWIWRKLGLIQTPLACLVLALVIVMGADLLSHALTGQQQFSVPTQWGLLRAVPLFVVGLALARMVELANLDVGRARALALSGAAAFLISAVLHGPDMLNVLATMAVLTGLGAGGSGRIWPGAAWGARISFSLFITHIPSAVIYFDGLAPVLAKLPAGAAAQWAAWAGALLFAVAMAAAFHYGLDEPLQRRLRSALSGPRRPVLSPSAQGG